jgi:hypothetical protein
MNAMIVLDLFTTFPENENGSEEPFLGENIKLLFRLFLFQAIPAGRN